MNYVRLKKLSKKDLSKAKIGKTYMLSYNEDGKKTYFKFDPQKQLYQYMIGYSSIISKELTEEMRKFLPPLQFREEIVK